MTRLLTDKPRRSLDEVLDALGNVPISRIRLPFGTATEDDVIDILDRGTSPACELVDGVLVEKPVAYRESAIAAEITRLLGNFVRENDLGIVVGADGPTRLRRGLVRIPDSAFASWSRFPDGVPEDPISKVAPDLAVEVISESNTEAEMERKLGQYFDAGVRLVWYVYPKTRSAIVYSSPKRMKEIGPDGALEGGKVLPGFSMPLVAVFSVLSRRRKGDGSR